MLLDSLSSLKSWTFIMPNSVIEKPDRVHWVVREAAYDCCKLPLESAAGEEEEEEEEEYREAAANIVPANKISVDAALATA